MCDLTEFVAEHGSMLRQALQTYSDRMKEEATRARQTYDHLMANPDEAAKQDQSLFMTRAFLMSAEMFEDAANRAEATYKAVEAAEEEMWA